MNGIKTAPSRPTISRSPTYANGSPTALASTANFEGLETSQKVGNAVLELSDGSAFEGISFGAPGKSVAGECVFQTGTLFHYHPLQQLLEVIFS